MPESNHVEPGSSRRLDLRSARGSIPAFFVFFVIVVHPSLPHSRSPIPAGDLPGMTDRRIAAIFDLDGTLVQTESLKALSYARAAEELCPDTVREQDVIAAYTGMVGLSREEVAARLLARFELEAQRRAADERAGSRDATRCVHDAAPAHLRGDDRGREAHSRAGISLVDVAAARGATRLDIPSASRRCRIASTRCSCSSGSGSRARWTCS